MPRKPARPILLALSLILAAACPACSATPEVDPASIQPIPDNYRDLIHDHMEYSVLREFAEGYRADYDIKEPYLAKFQKHESGEWDYGWGVNVFATTPVRYGGYIAGKKHQYFFDRGRMRRVMPGDKLRKL